MDKDLAPPILYVNLIIQGLRDRAGGSEEKGVARAVAATTEGRCPFCEGHSSPIPVFEEDESNRRKPTAVVNCHSCHLRWQSGTEASGDWLSFAAAMEDEMRFEMCFNPPEDEST